MPLPIIYLRPSAQIIPRGAVGVSAGLPIATSGFGTFRTWRNVWRWSVVLEPSRAQTIAISLHELATNAAKYGSLSAAGGRVEIAWSLTADGRLSLRWIESGGPTLTPPTHRGFGTRVMENMIGQLRGEVRFDWRAKGLTCEITLLLA